ncbi:MAG: GtrA family protein [Clostridiales Family XIII bacterium]|jgi:putative flippase GtrA|nr:GtrA family protein [Clostridiales Family XIII bacterium]
MKELFRKRRHFVLYGVFGVLTTAVNYAVYFCVYAIPGTHGTTVPNVLAWIGAVLFAYATNRRWVFDSKASGARARAVELAKFSGSRLFSLGVETVLLYVLVDRLGYSNLLIKILLSVVIVVMNYVLSRFWVFTHE